MSYANLGLESVKALLIFDNGGNVVLGKYFCEVSALLPKKLFEKIRGPNAEVLLVDGLMVLSRTAVDLHFAVLAGTDENEIAISLVLDSFLAALAIIFKLAFI